MMRATPWTSSKVFRLQMSSKTLKRLTPHREQFKVFQLKDKSYKSLGVGTLKLQHDEGRSPRSTPSGVGLPSSASRRGFGSVISTVLARSAVIFRCSRGLCVHHIRIDAWKQGGYARFTDHSCQTNYKVERWTVGGLPGLLRWP